MLTYLLEAEGLRVVAFLAGWALGITSAGILALVIEP